MISDTGPVQKRLNRISEIAVQVPDSHHAMELALLRVRKGNPPHKYGSVKSDDANQDKLCDSYIWELVKEHLRSVEKVSELLFFSKNHSDWCIKVGEEEMFNPQLDKEIVNEFGVNVTYKTSFEDLPQIEEKVKAEVEVIEGGIEDADIQNYLENELPESLRKSHSWDNTDRIIKQSLPYLDNVSMEQVAKILQASLENGVHSAGPYNQVLMASKSNKFFGKLYRVGKSKNHPVEMWADFYVKMDSLSRKSFDALERALNKRDYYYLEDANEMVYIPF